MLANGPARTSEQTTSKVDIKIVPVAELIRTSSMNGQEFRRETLATFHAAVATTSTRTETTTSIPSILRNMGKITDRAIAGNTDALNAGQTVEARTLRGNLAGKIVPDRRSAEPTAAAATKTPALAARPMSATLADLIAPALPRPNNNIPFAGLAMAIAGKGLANALTETPKERTIRERREQEEAAKLKAAQTDLGRARTEIEGKLAATRTEARKSIAPEASRIEAIAASTAATPEAARTALEIARAIETRIAATDADRKEAPALKHELRDERSILIATPTATLAARYESEGAEGRFKAHILEALTTETPAPEAARTMKMLEGTAFGAALIAKVEQDRTELAEPAPRSARNERLPENRTPFAGLIESLDLENLAFPAGLRRHAREHGTAALAA